jgi:16S rRNA (uracil1498-N3)-methyltransferase
VHFFYTPHIDPSSPVLNEQESHHCVKVLRLKEGDAIQVADGKGNLFHATILLAHPKHCSFSIQKKEINLGKLGFDLEMAVAPTKNIDRFEWFAEKAVELGVTTIYPIICEHSERKIIKPERLTTIMVSAMKQSLSAFLPTLHPAISFTEFLQQNQNKQGNLLAHCYDLPKTPLADIPGNLTRYCLCIGPEGDFSPKEIEQALNLDYQAVSLGNRRLRTETAALYALQHIHFLKSRVD